MLIDITRWRAIETWLAVLALVAATAWTRGLVLTVGTCVVLLALAAVPPAIALLLWPVGHPPNPAPAAGAEHRNGAGRAPSATSPRAPSLRSGA